MRYALGLFLLLLPLLFSCENEETNVPVNITDRAARKEFERIMKRQKLVVLAENSSTSYFIYKGKKMGFEYEMLKEFANEMGLALEIKLVGNLDNLQDMLNAGEGDIIACNYTITKERTKDLAFSEPFFRTPQVLIQKKPATGQEDKLITDASDLVKKHIHVWENSSYHQRLLHLQEELGDTIYINKVDGKIGGEELIEMVSQGIIDYTIAEENIAMVNARFYDNIDYSVKISTNQRIAFGLKKSNILLKAKLDSWIERFTHSKLFAYMNRKYFEIGSASMMSQTTYSNTSGGKISPYDAFFKEAGKKTGVDWRLVASIAYQESKFNPYIESFGGAYGMMQFMPNTGPYYGVYPDSPPDVQILGGAKKLKSDIDFWKEVPDMEQRMKFALASYNAGRGHIKDAQRLTKKHGGNGLVWDNEVENMLLNLSKQEYYRDEVVKSGSMRGTLTHHYVQTVFRRFKEWELAFE